MSVENVLQSSPVMESNKSKIKDLIFSEGNCCTVFLNSPG